MRKLIIIILMGLSISYGNAQTVITVSGVDTTLIDGNGYDLNQTTETILTVENSKIATPFSGAYLLKCGEDGYNASTAENINGAVIKGNYLDYTGTTYSGSIHSVMAGYNLDYNIQHNYFNKVYLGVVAEGGYQNGDSMVNVNYNIRHNIFNNVSLPLSMAGYDSINFTNNTVYFGGSEGLWMLKNIINIWGGLDEGAIGKNLKIKNNIFYTVNNRNMIFIEDGCLEGFECDYNIYYVENASNNEPRFNLGGTVYSWTQWQVLGYDTHSVIRDPNFNNITDFVPAADIAIGIDLGTVFQYGLSASADWVVGTPPDTALQSGVWDVGARVINTATDNKYYVAHPDSTYAGMAQGDDNADGSFATPWATIQKGFNTATSPGDTVLYRSGTWMMNEDSSPVLNFDPDASNGGNGAYGNWIVHQKYPDDVGYITIDLSENVVVGSSAGLRIRNTSHVKFSGFEISYNWGRPTDNSCVDVTIASCGNLELDNMSLHDGGGLGIGATTTDSLYIINVDTYNHCDSLDPGSPGGDADGFIISSGYDYGEGDHVFVEISGCRAWNNSDDGIDLTTSKQFYVHDNWAFFNGILYKGGYAGDGTGIKTSGSHIQDVTKRRVHNNVLAFNEADGGGGGVSELNLYALPTSGGTGGPFMELYNNTFYKNYKGYNSGVSGGDWVYGTGIDSASVVSANNLIYLYTRTPVGYSEFLTDLGAYDPPYTYTTTTTDSWDWIDPPNHWYNRYNPAFTISDGDFVSVDSATIYSQMTAPRKLNGDLPDVTVFNLVASSDLIDGGTDVGLPFSGDTPDLGAFEYGIVVPNDSIILTTTQMITDSLASGARESGEIVFINMGAISGDYNFACDSVVIKKHRDAFPNFNGGIIVSGVNLLNRDMRFNGGISVTGDRNAFRKDSITRASNIALLATDVAALTIDSCYFSAADTAIYVTNTTELIFRDNEVHGDDVIIAITPPGADPDMFDYFIEYNAYYTDPLATFNIGSLSMSFFLWRSVTYPHGAFDRVSTIAFE